MNRTSRPESLDACANQLLGDMGATHSSRELNRRAYVIADAFLGPTNGSARLGVITKSIVGAVITKRALELAEVATQGQRAMATLLAAHDQNERDREALLAMLRDEEAL